MAVTKRSRRGMTEISITATAKQRLGAVLSTVLPERISVASGLKKALSILLRLVRASGFPRSPLRHLKACHGRLTAG